MPDYPIPEAQFVCVLGEQWEKQNVKRQNLSLTINMISDLPTDAATCSQNTDTLSNYQLVKFNVLF
jgi:hypothetical protein